MNSEMTEVQELPQVGTFRPPLRKESYTTWLYVGFLIAALGCTAGWLLFGPLAR